ncbi:hypothetical protein G9U51_06275 [Calidifontibacter sp. DB0510]|uniref:Rhamnogalacturonan lyase domain-containing protein n=1 Tax=Metallococcus carri TaxID=1656884 RepID=A0A967AZT0_9MICO|nr:hypothetical protein [Metallococcus carri]NHN55389.1 hypothetical protein [Metallococcus carri]NOP36466.1 hypothetical protein [Calidifontibacter sp. DB2511S]
MVLPFVEPRPLPESGLRAVGDVGIIRLHWRAQTGVCGYEVHGVSGAAGDWRPSPGTLLATVDEPRFAHRGLGALAQRWSYRVLPAGVLPSPLPPPQPAVSRTSVTVTGIPLATVGSFDGSGLELALAPTGFVHYQSTFPRDVDFRHGLDRADVRWSYLQPGPDDAWAGRRGHRFRLRFDLDEVPDHDVDLALWLVDRHPSRAGSATVSLNGTRVDTLFFDEPATAQVEGAVRPGAGAGPAYLEHPIGREHLQLGENVLDIEKDQGSWIAYDALGVFGRPR